MDTAEDALQRFVDRLDQHRARLDSIRDEVTAVVGEGHLADVALVLDFGNRMAVHDATMMAAAAALLLIHDLIEGASRDLEGGDTRCVAPSSPCLVLGAQRLGGPVGCVGRSQAGITQHPAV